jgi:endonuclease YncB( thermonuclease family)
MILGRLVIVRWRKRGAYRRIIGQVYWDNRYISRQMVAAGWAVLFRRYSKNPVLAQAEEAARKRGLGMWGPRHAVRRVRPAEMARIGTD